MCELLDPYALEHRINLAEEKSKYVKAILKNELKKIDLEISRQNVKPVQNMINKEFENIEFSFPTVKRADRCVAKIGDYHTEYEHDLSCVGYLKDVLRCSVILEDPEKLVKVFNSL